MILIFTLDDQNGVSLAGKRQSSDREVARRICALVGDNVLWVKTKTATFFNNVTTTCKSKMFNSFDELKATTNDICFLEEVPPNELLNQAERIYVFRWNRRYPSLAKDRLSLEKFSKAVLCEFPGYSHEKITLEVYTK